MYLKQIVYLIIVNLKKGTENSKFVLFFFMQFDLLKQLKNGSGNKPSIILVSRYILKECVLLLLLVFHSIFNHIFPITAEHSICLARSCLSICKNSEIIPLGNFGNVVVEMTIYLSLRGLLR